MTNVLVTGKVQCRHVLKVISNKAEKQHCFVQHTEIDASSDSNIMLLVVDVKTFCREGKKSTQTMLHTHYKIQYILNISFCISFGWTFFRLLYVS